jgi:hypothetical protein
MKLIYIEIHKLKELKKFGKTTLRGQNVIYL